jgi:plasmid stability protein
MAIIYIKEFPDDLHTRLKIQAAVEKTTMKDLIIRLIEEHLAKQANQRKEG